MGKLYILDKNRNVVPVSDVKEWGKSNNNHVRVAQSLIKSNFLLWLMGIRPHYWVSTVFLGMDHSTNINGAPLVFETMIFPKWVWWKKKEDDIRCLEWLDLDTKRYATWNQALNGHIDMRDKWMEIAKSTRQETEYNI